MAELITWHGQERCPGWRHRSPCRCGLEPMYHHTKDNRETWSCEVCFAMIALEYGIELREVGAKEVKT